MRNQFITGAVIVLVSMFGLFWALHLQSGWWVPPLIITFIIGLCAGLAIFFEPGF